MKKILSCLIILALFAIPLGCPGQNGQDESKEKITVLLDWFPNTNHTGLYVAQELGYYEEEGLEVEIIQPAEGGTAQLIASGQGDFGVSYQEEVTIARSQDIPVVAIAAVIQHNTSGFASPVDKNIKSPLDFEGKSYGGWGSPAETAIIQALLDKYQGDINKVNFINIGSADFFTSIQKDIDFSMIYWGWTGIEAEIRNIDLNFIPIADEIKALDFYTPVLIANEDKIARDPDLISSFLKATARGYQYAIESPKEAADILLQRVPELDPELVRASQQYLAGQYQAEAAAWGVMNLEVWKNYVDFMYENKLIEKNIDASQAFTNDFLPRK
ncbi:MAG: ABC transporter substrate-binding protein [Syntrophomonadaceae bacterium]|jgi:ABC-type nitrate/sulfonate/bicarbonate transport system substrate-binding protein|nr:ABC transporter substrate-binding protein [Syntrophomonadaceae bacterium]